ncbi:MAG: MerR family transcriptional regulator, partial [Actinomycetales bacterium]|nr:MerR family transcriptional regulator [Actinomycetales bacterium]
MVSELRFSQEADQERSTSPGLTVAAVARRLGVAPATLRTWDRRYGLGPSEHRAGAHRRYSAVDLTRLEHMRRLVLAGLPPGDAAREALALDVDPSALASVTELAMGSSSADTSTQPISDPTPLRSGGGQVIPLPGGTPASCGLARAALALDGHACQQIMR